MWSFFSFVTFLFSLYNRSAVELPSVGSLVASQGYAFEEHQVMTEDGYILSLHRIPYGKNSSGKIGRPVILQHGILVSSACWVIGRTENSLGFLLADHGYDVWMPNSRGNTFSMKHVDLEPFKNEDQKKFWDFSFHEMGYYDLPAVIDYVLNKTEQERLHFVGHSQGTTQFFAMMSMKPEYNKKVVHMSAMAPIAYFDHTRGSLKVIIFFGSLLIKMARLLRMEYLLISSPTTRFIEKIVCKEVEITRNICETVMFLLAGYDAHQINTTLIPIITTYTPAGSSAKQLVHYEQLAKNGDKFTAFDYGRLENMLRYKQYHPPEYDLSKVTIPVMLHFSQNDWISGIKDIKKLRYMLPNSQSRLVPYYYFNHVDFMWANDASELLYIPMIENMKKY